MIADDRAVTLRGRTRKAPRQLLRLRLPVTIVVDAALEDAVAVGVEFCIGFQGVDKSMPRNNSQAGFVVDVRAAIHAVLNMRYCVGPAIAIGIESGDDDLTSLGVRLPFEASVEVIIALEAYGHAANVIDPARIDLAVGVPIYRVPAVAADVPTRR